MTRSYLDYAMSVIVSRALPDVRDGLKPVHRRILYGMKEGGYDWNRAYRKSARIVGDVMGKYHPHGDSAIYDAMVRMAQTFSMRLPLIDGQGNFGSIDGDPPAAMRYTEARLDRAASELLDDIDRDTVDFRANYDETTSEPTVLPAKYPNILVNGGGGIAVGMATNIPPHNLGEVIDGTIALIDEPDISIERLIEIIPGPDFPTGGLILGRAGIETAYREGRGSVVMRARTHTEPAGKDREAIIVTEIPYQVNKSRLVESIAQLVRDKRVEGISDLRDESDRHGMRIVIELRREAMAEIVLNQLFRYSALQASFGVNMLALDGGRPRQLGLKDVLEAFVAFREEVVTRRTVYELGKARDRLHLLVGLAMAVANIDEVIALIRAAPDPDAAKAGLMERAWPAETVRPLIELLDEPGRGIEKDGTARLSEAQARGILELRLQRLTGLERSKIDEESAALAENITDYLDILGSRERKREIMKEELREIRERFGDDRRTEITDAGFEHDIEDLIQPEEMVVTVTHGGYIKRVPLATYRTQARGGKGRSGMSTRDEDFVHSVFVANTHAPLLFFSSHGMVYTLKVYRLPVGNPTSRGKAMVNLLPLAEGETITTVMPLPVDEAEWQGQHIMFATSLGNVRRNDLADFTNIKANGKIAMKLAEGDQLVGVALCSEEHDVLLACRGGKCIRFRVPDVRVFSGRTSTGVRGIRLAKDDVVVSMSILTHAAIDMEVRDDYLRAAAAGRRVAGNGNGNGVEGEAETVTDEDRALAESLTGDAFAGFAEAEEFILSVTENGFGKRTSAYEYRITKRGGQGIVNIATSDRNGPVVASFPVAPGDQLVMVSDQGQLIRFPVEGVRIAGRNTQGVTLFKVAEDEHVTSAFAVPEEGDDDDAADADAPDGDDGAADSGEAAAEA